MVLNLKNYRFVYRLFYLISVSIFNCLQSYRLTDNGMSTVQSSLSTARTVTAAAIDLFSPSTSFLFSYYLSCRTTSPIILVLQILELLAPGFFHPSSVVLRVQHLKIYYSLIFVIGKNFSPLSFFNHIFSPCLIAKDLELKWVLLESLGYFILDIRGHRFLDLELLPLFRDLLAKMLLRNSISCIPRSLFFLVNPSISLALQSIT